MLLFYSYFPYILTPISQTSACLANEHVHFTWTQMSASQAAPVSLHPNQTISELTSVSAWGACWWSRSCLGEGAAPPRRWRGWRRAGWRGARRSPGSWTWSAAPCWTSGWSRGEPAGCCSGGRQWGQRVLGYSSDLKHTSHFSICIQLVSGMVSSALNSCMHTSHVTSTLTNPPDFLTSSHLKCEITC